MYTDEAFRRSKSFSVSGLLEFLIIALMNNFETLLRCALDVFFISFCFRP